MRRLILLPILALALFTGAAVAPSAVTAKAPAPIVEDACACGGTIYFVLDGRSYSGGYTTCHYQAYFGNGQPAPWDATQRWPGNVSCPPQPVF